MDGRVSRYMRCLSLLLLTIVIFTFVPGAADGACSRTSCSRASYVDTVEWLGVGDLGMDLDMPDQSSNEAKDTTAAEPEENVSQSVTDENGVEDVEVVEEDDAESGEGDQMDLILIGDVTGKVDLALFQSGDLVFGRGNLTAGGIKNEMGVTGSARDKALSLHLVPLDGSRLYVLDLEIEDGSIRGSYEAYGSDGLHLSGRADSTLFA